MTSQPPLVLNAQLAHMGVSAALDFGAVGEAQRRPFFGQHPYHAIYRILLLHAQTVPPRFEFSGKEHVGHKLNIAQREYRVKGIRRASVRTKLPSTMARLRRRHESVLRVSRSAESQAHREALLHLGKGTADPLFAYGYGFKY